MLDKAIASGKEWRKPYRGSKAIDRTCRNNCGCPWCEENRRHKFVAVEKKMLDKLNEWVYNELTKEEGDNDDDDLV